MLAMCEMDVFPDKKDSVNEFLNNLYFGEKTRIQKLEGFENLILNDKKQVIDFVKQVKCLKGFNVLQNLINVMEDRDKWNSIAFLEIADGLSGDEEANELLVSNCIQPIIKSILQDNFSWETLKMAYKSQKNVEKACEIFNLKKEELTHCLGDIEKGVYQDFSVYRIAKYGEKALGHAKRFRNISDYETAVTMCYFEEFPDVVDKFIGHVPNSVLSTILIFAKVGEDLKALDFYESKFDKPEFWEKSLGFNNVLFTSEKITKEHALNILCMYQLLHGSIIEHYGNEPIKNIFIEKVYRRLKNEEAPPYTARMEPLQEDHSLYFIHADKYTYRFCDMNLPYILERVEQMINSINVPAVSKCDIDWRGFSGHKNTSLLITYLNTKEYTGANDRFQSYGLSEVLPVLPLSEIINLLVSFSRIGDKLKCFDPVLLFCVHVLLKSNFDAKKWCQVYLSDPLIFTYCFCRAIAGYLFGADDYVKLFTLNNAQWYQSFQEIGFMIREYYNLAASCFNYLLVETSKVAHYQEGLSQDYNFPNIVIIRDRNGNEKKIDLYEVLYYPKDYANLLKRSIIGDVACTKNEAGELVISTYREVT